MNLRGLLRDSNRGLSMIELAVSFFIFAILAGSTFLIFSQLFGGQRSVDRNIEAAMELEKLAEQVRQKAKESWPEPVALKGALPGEMTYRVDDLGIQVDPLDDKLTLELKRVRVEVSFRVRTPSGKDEEKTISSVFLVGR